MQHILDKCGDYFQCWDWVFTVIWMREARLHLASLLLTRTKRKIGLQSANMADWPHSQSQLGGHAHNTFPHRELFYCLCNWTEILCLVHSAWRCVVQHVVPRAYGIRKMGSHMTYKDPSFYWIHPFCSCCWSVLSVKYIINMTGANICQPNPCYSPISLY